MRPGGCVDTPGWVNSIGVDCDVYASEHCAGGRFLPAGAWASGVDFGEPEKHCCACGKPPDRGPGDISSDSGCVDTVGWQNLFGATCDDYSSAGRCAGGAFTPGEEWTSGHDFGEPEKHCCECGKPAPCVDTPHWRNHYGATCSLYEAEGHCRDGAFLPAHEYTAAAEFGSPWKHCCACGKGRGSPPPLPPPPPPPPPPQRCTDTPGWRNPFGKDCAEMAAEHCRCAGGFRPEDCGFVVGHEWTGGVTYLSPELHCCICGKGRLRPVLQGGATLAVAPRHSSRG